MKLAIFSDIHANLPALEAVLADIDARQPDAVYCLGDLVGYATWPNEVVESIQSRHIPTIAGNYDVGVGAGSADCGCAYETELDNQRGVESIAYTNSVVTEEVRTYLRGLPRHLRLSFSESKGTFDLKRTFEVLMVHGSPRRINEYLFVDRPDSSLLRMMGTASADVMLFGHTHKPYHKVLSEEVEGQARYRHAINLGSVGKPKDGDPRACYVLLDVADEPTNSRADRIEVEFVRVPYDVERAAQAVEASPLPDAFAQMLREAF
jgi:predicted phosphodiesterase